MAGGKLNWCPYVKSWKFFEGFSDHLTGWENERIFSSHCWHSSVKTSLFKMACPKRISQKCPCIAAWGGSQGVVAFLSCPIRTCHFKQKQIFSQQLLPWTKEHPKPRNCCYGLSIQSSLNFSLDEPSHLIWYDNVVIGCLYTYTWKEANCCILFLKLCQRVMLMHQYYAEWQDDVVIWADHVTGVHECVLECSRGIGICQQFSQRPVC